MTGFSEHPGQFLDDFLELEAAASAPYCRFTYASETLTRQVQTLLIERGVGEFAPPSGRLYMKDGQPAGIIACLTGERLQRARLAAAWALTRARVLDERVSGRVHLAATTLQKLDLADFYLSRIAVHPDHRGQGVGAVLMSYVLDEARHAAARRCVLEVAPEATAAIAMYRRHGFVEVDRRRVEDADTGRSLEYVHMACTL